MKIQYCSDLHLEFWENRNFLEANPIVPTGEILILAGDIMLFSETYRHKDFFDFLSKNFKAVYWIPGNHEYYHSNMNGRVGSFREQIRDNVFLLNDTVEIIDDVRFVFSSLWSFIGKEAEHEIWHSLNDFRLIKVGKQKLTPAIYNKLHLESKEFLTNALRAKFDGNTVVITHHVPTMMNYPPQYLGDALNMAFASELRPLIEETQPDYWIYGHHHVHIPAYKIGKTTMLTNQLGYVSANEFLDFNTRAIIEPTPTRQLFLDDLRVPTDCISYMHRRTAQYELYKGKWIIVRNYSEFTYWICENGLPDLISFDHDLGIEDEGHPSGMECAKWLVEYCLDNQLKLPRWLVHSANPAGAENITGLLISFEKKHLK